MCITSKQLISGVIIALLIPVGIACNIAGWILPTPVPTTEAAPWAPVPEGIIGWWPGEGNAQDLIADHNGTLQGGVSFTTGKVNQAFQFNGVDGTVDILPSPVFDVGEQVSIEFWIKPTLDNAMQNCQGLNETKK